jgi:hypothetical protein
MTIGSIISWCILLAWPVIAVLRVKKKILWSWWIVLFPMWAPVALIWLVLLHRAILWVVNLMRS